MGADSSGSMGRGSSALVAFGDLHMRVLGDRL